MLESPEEEDNLRRLKYKLQHLNCLFHRAPKRFINFKPKHPLLRRPISRESL
jgi:hypothetical protein